MLSRKMGEQAGALFIAALAGWFLVDSRRLDYLAEFGRPGPGFFPTWLSIGLLVVAGLLFLAATFQRTAPMPVAPGQVAEGSPLKPILVLAILGLIVPALPVLGFPLTIALFLAFVLGVVERVRWWGTLLVALLGSGSLYLLFGVWLQIRLPMGMVIQWGW